MSIEYPQPSTHHEDIITQGDQITAYLVLVAGTLAETACTTAINTRQVAIHDWQDGLNIGKLDLETKQTLSLAHPEEGWLQQQVTAAANNMRAYSATKPHEPFLSKTEVSGVMVGLTVAAVGLSWAARSGYRDWRRNRSLRTTIAKQAVANKA